MYPSLPLIKKGEEYVKCKGKQWTDGITTNKKSVKRDQKDALRKINERKATARVLFISSQSLLIWIGPRAGTSFLKRLI